MAHARTRKTWTKVALCATLPVLWLALMVAGPASAQTNSPSGGQGTGQAPTQGGTSGDAGPNVGGDGQAGNRSTPGGGGATGGGSSGAGGSDTGGSSKTGIVVGVVALLAVIGVAVAISSRHRRVMEDVEEGAPAGR